MACLHPSLTVALKRPPAYSKQCHPSPCQDDCKVRVWGSVCTIKSGKISPQRAQRSLKKAVTLQLSEVNRFGQDLKKFSRKGAKTQRKQRKLRSDAEGKNWEQSNTSARHGESPRRPSEVAKDKKSTTEPRRAQRNETGNHEKNEWHEFFSTLSLFRFFRGWKVGWFLRAFRDSVVKCLFELLWLKCYKKLFPLCALWFKFFVFW